MILSQENISTLNSVKSEIKKKEGKLIVFKNGSYKYIPSIQYQQFKEKQQSDITLLNERIKLRNTISTVKNQLDCRYEWKKRMFKTLRELEYSL